MEESDFKGAQPYLFGENFAGKAKWKLDAAAATAATAAAAALRKSVYPSATKGKEGFQWSHPCKLFGWKGGRVNNYVPG